MPSPTVYKVRHANLSNSVQARCENLVDAFAEFTSAEPIELLEDILITVNRLLSGRYPAVSVELDRYAPAFCSGALRLTKGAYVYGMTLGWTPTSLTANDGDFVGRFDEVTANRIAVAKDMLAYIVGFIASHLD